DSEKKAEGVNYKFEGTLNWNTTQKARLQKPHYQLQVYSWDRHLNFMIPGIGGNPFTESIVTPKIIDTRNV
ncbi:19151_t:CDS:2, partial [Entrophospora sp. SA101]